MSSGASASMSVSGDLDTKISVNPFDQILALSQKSINESFLNLSLNDSSFSKFDDVAGQGSSITGAKLDYPRVMLSPTAQDLQSVIYVLVFKSGTCKLENDPETGDNPNDKTDPKNAIWEADMSGWHVGFPVKITQQALAQNDKQHVQLSGYADVDPANFTTQQLLADLSAADFASMNDFTYYKLGARNENGGYVNHWDQLSSDTQGELAYLLSVWILGRGQKKKTLLGQTLTKSFSNATGPAATFQPQQMRYQTYPYIQPDGQFQPASLDGNGILNTILYTQMLSGNLPQSAYQPQDQEGRGNWFTNADDPEPSHYGSFAIKQDFWLTKFILPKLRAFNAALEGRVDFPELYVHCSYDWKTIKSTASFMPQFSCGTSFNWAADSPVYDFEPPTDPNGTTYTWSSHFTTNRNPNWSADSGSNRATGKRQSDSVAGGTEGSTAAELTTRNTHTLTITPGSNVLKLAGVNEVYLYWEFTGVIPPFHATTRYVANWSVDITLNSVSDGGLQIMCNNRQYNVSTPNLDNKFGSINDQIRDLMTVGFQQLDTFENQIQNAVQGLERFVFPGQGVFFFRNPRVGHEKCLAVDLGYDGTFTAPTVNGAPARADPTAPVAFLGNTVGQTMSAST